MKCSTRWFREISASFSYDFQPAAIEMRASLYKEPAPMASSAYDDMRLDAPRVSMMTSSYAFIGKRATGIPLTACRCTTLSSDEIEHFAATLKSI